MLAAPQSSYDIALSIWREVKHISGNVARQGWRPAYCWVGAFIPLWAYVYAPAHNIQIDLGAVNTFATIILGAFVARSMEKRKGVA